MNEIPQVARLQQVDIRKAWAHEALNFTPWLYSNLDALGEAIGMKLEGEGSEVAVESFAADILARNVYDGTLVLIENQLDVSDHSHLGQIMTYLAGLDAKTIVWVASNFREPHLSAINWLNENTGESISFFAVQLKVVQIADSPLAPVFDVVARPNNWERKLHAATQSESGKSERSQRRYAFWQAFVERVPGELERGGQPAYASNRWRVVEGIDVIISMYVGRHSVGIFLRAPFNGAHEEVRESILSHADALVNLLGVPMGNNPEHHFASVKNGDYTDPNQWDELIAWLSEKADLYEQTLREVFGDSR